MVQDHLIGLFVYLFNSKCRIANIFFLIFALELLEQEIYGKIDNIINNRREAAILTYFTHLFATKIMAISILKSLHT